jgi:hypothetical protein
MLSQGSGLFCVDSSKRSPQQNEVLKQHPWRTRLNAYLHEAGEFGADWVYFRLSVGAGAPRPELFIYNCQEHGLAAEGEGPSLARLCHQLWNYGRVPLVLILRPTKVDIYNLLPPPDFDDDGRPKEPKQIQSLSLTPADSIALAGAATKGIYAADQFAWSRFSARQFDSGAFWEAQENRNLAKGANSVDSLVSEMREVRRSLEKQTQLNATEEKKNWFIRRLIIITLMVRFLEDRRILPAAYFKDQGLAAETFTALLRYPRALLQAIRRLEQDFNGDVFHVDPALREILSSVEEGALAAIANFAAGDMKGRQRHFWQRYSFRYLPVEVISYIYEDFLAGRSQAYFTPHHLVDLLLDEAMPEKDLLAALEGYDPRRRSSLAAYPVLDPACGSGVFLVGAWRRLADAFCIRKENRTPALLKELMMDNLFGADIERGSVELTIFSLCVALCSEFPERPGDPSYAFNQLKELKFPNLTTGNILESDFFACRKSFLKSNRRFRLVIGNPPFESRLKTQIQKDFDCQKKDEDGNEWSPVPDYQISYLFLRGAMPLVSDGGTACLVQPAGLIYNENPIEFRRQLFSTWHVSQIFDFASISGLFTTRKHLDANRGHSRVGIKTVAVFVRRQEPDEQKPILHATFRRTTVLNQRQVFEIDPQDLHWIPRNIAITEPRVWKANLLGGGRLLDVYKSFGEHTLGTYLKNMRSKRQWISSEGFTEADVQSYLSETAPATKQRYTPKRKPERANWDLLLTDALTDKGITPNGIKRCGIEWYLWPRDDRLFSPPHILIKEHPSLPVVFRRKGARLLFRDQVIGIAAPPADISKLENIYQFLTSNREFLEFFAAFGAKYLIGRQAALLKKNIMDLPYSEGGGMCFRGIQTLLRDDVISFMIPLIKDTERGRHKLVAPAKESEVKTYAGLFVELMQSVYPDLHFGGACDLNSGWCVTFHKGNTPGTAFGDTEVLRKHLDALLSRETGRSLRTWRIVRHFSGNDLFIVKPKPRRYWLKSTAISDADHVFAWALKQRVRARPRRSKVTTL